MTEISELAISADKRILNRLLIANAGKAQTEILSVKTRFLDSSSHFNWSLNWYIRASFSTLFLPTECSTKWPTNYVVCNYSTRYFWQMAADTA
jgi:hypothetical protein